ncbi:MAG: immunoglobulin domain-containing protein [Verrucomicrobiales bacterium]|nr:immunoglobulin domain-containing protein [Verrucomicrobiales bacterium]
MKAPSIQLRPGRPQTLSPANLFAVLALGLLLSAGPRPVLAQDFLTNGLAGYWPFDDGVGSLAHDSSGHGNDGVLHPGATWDEGIIGKAIHFSGTSDSFVRVPSSVSLSASSGLTLAAWLKAESDGVIVSKWDDINEEWSYILKSWPSIELSKDWHNDLVSLFLWGQGTSSGEWTHLAATFDSDSSLVRLYANGVVLGDQQTAGGSIQPCSADMLIGAVNLQGPSATENFRGVIDEVRVYSRALTAGEILALYESRQPSDANLTNAPPLISFQPIGQEVTTGDTSRLEVGALGTRPLVYQWSKDGVNLPNATNATLVLTNIRLTEAGDYTVVVRNAFGAATSAAARVTVTERPWPYFADFEGPAGHEWSHRQTEATPIGNRRFLGQFSNETVSLRLNGLPAHSAVTVSFDLFVIRSWDANGTCGGGPDIWQLEVLGRPPLLRATFSNTATTGVEECPGNQFQSFPGTFPDSVFPAQTDAAERDTLGYFAYGDSVYSMSFTIEHGDPSVRFDFTGMGLQGIADESWGLDNVRVELTPPVGTPYVGTDLSAVGALAAPNPGQVHRLAISGTRALVAVGDYAVALVDLKDPTKPVWLGTWESLFPPSAFVLAGSTAFIASYELDFLSTVEIVDFTDPAQPVLKGYYDTEGYVLDLAVAGSRLYVADDEAGLAVVDLGNPARPVKVGGYTTKRSVQRVAVAGRYAYVADESTLLILDVSDPSYPFRVGLYDLGGPVQDLQVNWGTAYVLVGTGPLEILDVSDPGNVRPLGTHRTWGVQAMTVAGKYAYLAKGNRGLELVDLSDPAKPVWVTGLTTTGRAEDVAVMGQNVLVAGGDKGLLVHRLEQQIYPPLAPPVIADGLLTLSWPAMEGVRLQRTSELLPAKWEDVAESEGTNVVRLAMTGSTGFFRLAKGARVIVDPAILAGPFVYPGNGHVYYLLQPSSWKDAESKAESFGGTLAIVNDAAEDEWIYATFGMYVGGVPTDLWIGLTDEASEGTWVWVNGELPSYTNWDLENGEPNDAGGEDYAHIWGGPLTLPRAARSSRWNDYPNEPGPTYGVVEIGR